jgi:hypothetical protein
VDARTCQVGRMATAAAYRNRGIGGLVLDALERISALRGVAELTVHSQLPAEPFYASRGYAREGSVFQDQGVPHVLMRKVLVRAAFDPGAPSEPASASAVAAGRAPVKPASRGRAAPRATKATKAKAPARPATATPSRKRKAKVKAKVSRLAPPPRKASAKKPRAARAR